MEIKTVTMHSTDGLVTEARGFAKTEGPEGTGCPAFVTISAESGSYCDGSKAVVTLFLEPESATKLMYELESALRDTLPPN